MQAAARFVQVVHRRGFAPPAGTLPLTFGGTAMTFAGMPLTFQTA